MPHDTEDMIQLLLSTNKEQEQTIVDLRATIKELRSTIANLNETIDELKRKIFGTSSEKTRRPDQEEGIQEEETVTVVKEHTRTRRKSLFVQICMRPFP
ncbi:MAG: transposase domain-containing protein [Anaerobutyricum soehngenii]